MLDGVGLGVCLVGLAQAVELVFQYGRRHALIDDQGRIGPGADLRHSLADVQALWVLVARLLCLRSVLLPVPPDCICIWLQ